MCAPVDRNPCISTHPHPSVANLVSICYAQRRKTKREEMMAVILAVLAGGVRKFEDNLNFLKKCCVLCYSCYSVCVCAVIFAYSRMHVSRA
jgi:hypothetical protein